MLVGLGGYPVPHQLGQGNSGVEGNYIWNNSPGLAAGVSQYVPDECGKGRLVGDYIKIRPRLLHERQERIRQICLPTSIAR